MSDGDVSLNEALSSLSQVEDITSDDEFSEIARVRKARADVTEHARQSGDSAGMLLNGLIGESNAEIEAEKAEKQRRLLEAKERGRAEAEAAEAKRKQQAQEALEEEKRKVEEMKQNREKMLADLEKKRKKELGIVDEEEEARKRAEEEAKAARIAAEKAREAAEEAALKSSNEELADKIRLMKEQKAAEALAEANSKAKRKMLNIGIAAAVAIIAVVIVVGVVSTIKGNDVYKLERDYTVSRIELEPMLAAQLSDSPYKFDKVSQYARKVNKGPRPGGHGVAAPDKYGTVDLNKDIVK